MGAAHEYMYRRVTLFDDVVAGHGHGTMTTKWWNDLNDIDYWHLNDYSWSFTRSGINTMRQIDEGVV